MRIAHLRGGLVSSAQKVIASPRGLIGRQESPMATASLAEGLPSSTILARSKSRCRTKRGPCISHLGQIIYSYS